MKKTLRILPLLLIIFTLFFSLTSCGASVSDIGSAKAAADTLEFNFYEVTLVKKESELSEYEYGDKCSSLVIALKDGNEVKIYYAKSSSLAEDIYDALLPTKDDGDLCEISGKTVYIGSSEGISAATVRPWTTQLYHTFIEDARFMYLVEGFGNTFLITLGALLIGAVLGILIAVAKYYAEGNPKLWAVNLICDLYTTVIRGIPITVLLLIFYFVVLVSAEGVIVAIIAFGINSAAYMAELVRSGINAVDKGQMEAARSLGMSKWQAMRTIIFPQAIKNVLPAIGNECIALLKETSVAGYVAVVDLTRAANLIRNNTYDAFNPLILSALVYLILVVLMTKGLSVLERRLKRNGKH